RGPRLVCCGQLRPPLLLQRKRERSPDTRFFRPHGSSTWNSQSAPERRGERCGGGRLLHFWEGWAMGAGPRPTGAGWVEPMEGSAVAKARLRGILETLDADLAGPNQLRSAVAGLSREQLISRPVAGRWSACRADAGCGNHLGYVGSRGPQRMAALRN